MNSSDLCPTCLAASPRAVRRAYVEQDEVRAMYTAIDLAFERWRDRAASEFERGRLEGFSDAMRNVARYFENIATGQTPQEVIETVAVHARLGRLPNP